MKNEILNSLDVIQETCNETEIAVAEAIIQECYKAMDILGYSDTDVDQFNIIQEGKIMDDVKKQGEGQSKVMRILSFIPRLIAALFKAITGSLESTKDKVKKTAENVNLAVGATQNHTIVKIDGRTTKTKILDAVIKAPGAILLYVSTTIGMSIVINKISNKILSIIMKRKNKEKQNDQEMIKNTNNKNVDQVIKDAEEFLKEEPDKELEDLTAFLKRIKGSSFDQLSTEDKDRILAEVPEMKKADALGAEVSEICNKNATLFSIGFEDKDFKSYDKMVDLYKIVIYIDPTFKLTKGDGSVDTEAIKEYRTRINNYNTHLSKLKSDKNYKSMTDAALKLTALIESFGDKSLSEMKDVSELKPGKTGEELINNRSSISKIMTNIEKSNEAKSILEECSKLMTEADKCIIQVLKDHTEAINKAHECSELLVNSLNKYDLK